jgi:hypothetical protein
MFSTSSGHKWLQADGEEVVEWNGTALQGCVSKALDEMCGDHNFRNYSRGSKQDLAVDSPSWGETTWVTDLPLATILNGMAKSVEDLPIWDRHPDYLQVAAAFRAAALRYA